MQFAMGGRAFPKEKIIPAGRKPGPARIFTRVAFGLLSLMIPVILFEALINEWQAPVPEFNITSNITVRVNYVYPDSAAEAAGVRAGDTLSSINHIPFEWSSLATFAKTYRAGQKIHLTLERNGATVEADVPLVPIDQVALSQLILYATIILFWWSVSSITLWRFFQKAEVRQLYLLSQAIIVAFILPVMQVTIWSPFPTWELAASLCAANLCIPLAVHFVVTFSRDPVDVHHNKLFLVILYLSGIIASLLWALSISGFGFLVVSYLSIAITISILLTSLAFLTRYYSKLNEPGIRRQARFALAAAAMLVIPPVFLCSFPKLLQIRSASPPLVGGVSIIIGLGIGVYAIRRENLFRADRLLNRAVVYLILLAATYVLMVGPVVLLEDIIPGPWFIRSSIVAGLALLVAAYFTQIRERVQQWVDGMFYGGWHDYPEVIENISNALARSLDWDHLQDILTRQVPEMMQLSGAQLIVGENTGPPEPELAQPITEIPLIFEGKPYGVWIVGSRRDGDDFSNADRRILSTLIPQIETALYNILLVEELQQQLEEIRASRDLVTKMGHQLIRSREEEQAHLSRELHDGPLQELVGMNLQLGMLLSQLGTGRAQPSLNETLTGMREEVRRLMADLRQVCADLRPPLLDTLGLGSALQALADEWSHQNAIPVKLDLPPDASLVALPSEVSMNLYRVAQEALSNIAHHACAGEVLLELANISKPEGLILSIQDNGKGFEPEAVSELTNRNHYGLAGMQERVALIGGQWELSSSLGHGTHIQVTWLRSNWLVSDEARALSFIPRSE